MYTKAVYQNKMKLPQFYYSQCSERIAFFFLAKKKYEMNVSHKISKYSSIGQQYSSIAALCTSKLSSLSKESYHMAVRVQYSLHVVQCPCSLALLVERHIGWEPS